MNAVRKSLLLSFVDSYLSFIFQIASTVIVSRLLTPAEVGVFAIAAVFAAMASTFRDFGVAEYLIQERDLTTDKIRAALALNVIVSWSMAVLLVAIGPAAAAFYREPGVRDVMQVLALNFVLVPFGAVTQAWFRRELNYRPIVICNALSSVGSFVVAVVLAWRGFGAISLAWSMFAGIVVSVLATAWMRPAGFPIRPALRGIGQVFHFGKFAGAIYVTAQLGKGAPELLIGRASGAADVGMFSRGNGVVEMFQRLVMRPVLLICLPYFADAERTRGSIVPAYLRSVQLLTAVGWPLLGLLAVLAYPAIRVVYGEQWLAAVPLAQVLCIAGAVELVFAMSREALLSKGEPRRASALQMQIVGVQVLGLCAVFPFGLPGACWGLVAGNVAGLLLSQWHLRQGIGLDGRAFLSACARSSILTLAVMAPIVLLEQSVPIHQGNYLAWAVSAVAVAVPVWLAGLRLLRHPLWPEIVELLARLRLRT